VLQNGIDHTERVGPLVGEAEVLPVVNWCPVEPVAPGRVRQRDALRLAVPAGAAGEGLATLLGDHAEVTVGGAFALESWRKLCANAVSGVMALAGRPAEIFALDDVREVARALAHECAAVARAEGVELTDRDADDVIAWLEALPKDAGSSILTDRLAGRELEWEARNGVIGRLGRRHGVPTPMSDTVSALLHAGERRRADSPSARHLRHSSCVGNLTSKPRGHRAAGYRGGDLRHFDPRRELLQGPPPALAAQPRLRARPLTSSRDDQPSSADAACCLYC
jgi:2-dehydropantoate 2-reductase